jgi:N-acetylated-alpha-linked acidic dipeptidase
MSTYGDPGFSHHATMGQYLGLLLYHLSSDEVLPIDVVTYGEELEGLYDDLVEFLEGYDADLDLDELKDAVGTFKSSASEAKTLELLAVESQNEELIKVVNHKYRDFQRGFVSQGGLPNREFYKHVVTAPGLDTGKSTLLGLFRFGD